MKTVKRLLSIALAAGCLSTYASEPPVVNSYGTDPTSDMALIYAGGDTRPRWTTDDWMPYVAHTYADGHKDWFFDAFLVLEFHSASRGASFETSERGGSATKEDWEWLIDNHMSVISSLDSTIAIARAELGEPRMRHKVIIGVPSAIKQQTTPFGIIEGREMDFSKDADRLAADKWGIDLIVEKFNSAKFENVDLGGLYWVEEALYTNGSIMPEINEWIHSRHNLRTYWIPYYPSNQQFSCNWKFYGFDMAYHQPNYFFRRDVPEDRLEVTCRDSKKYGLGLELEFETQGLSRAQYDDPDSYYDRLVAYLDVFDKEGVFENSAVAWYSGSKGFIDMSRSNHPKDREICDRMAAIIAERQKAHVRQ
ncbi:MAG: DUF4855 domain-containing protein [Muribaculaceae bacterium]|nr:DUF4855 domain-containing protein [Muribaculaceae bacterium]